MILRSKIDRYSLVYCDTNKTWDGLIRGLNVSIRIDITGKANTPGEAHYY